MVTATVAPMAEAMADVLGMDAVYGCGPQVREGILSGSERGWSVPQTEREGSRGLADAEANGHDLSNAMATETPRRLCGSWPCAAFDRRESRGPLRRHAEANNWTVVDWTS